MRQTYTDLRCDLEFKRATFVFLLLSPFACSSMLAHKHTIASLGEQTPKRINTTPAKGISGLVHYPPLHRPNPALTLSAPFTFSLTPAFSLLSLSIALFLLAIWESQSSFLLPDFISLSFPFLTVPTLPL